MPEYRKAADFLSVHEAARVLCVSRATLYRMIANGSIRAASRPAARGTTGRYVILRSECDRYLGGIARSARKVPA